MKIHQTALATDVLAVYNFSIGLARNNNFDD